MKKSDGGGTADLVYVFGSFVADPVKKLLRHEGGIVRLTPKAFDVLIALIERRGEIVQKDELLALVWPNSVVEENNLHHHISTLRKVFHESISEHDYIVTLPGRGYRFVATVQELTRAEEELLARFSLMTVRLSAAIRTQTRVVRNYQKYSETPRNPQRSPKTFRAQVM